MTEPVHIPVLLAETLALLDPRPGETFADLTAGLGGHAAAFAARLGPEGTLVLVDLDASNLQRAESRVRSLKDAPRVVSIHGNFADAPSAMAARGLSAHAALADLGFASSQVDDPSRGLSFMRDGPLDMRLDASAPVTAAELVATLGEEELADLLREFGEEPAARSIAQKLVSARRESPILTTGRLAEIVRSAVRRPRTPGRRSIDPATRTFQALRIAVNDELGSLNGLLGAVRRAGASIAAGREAGWLRPGARVGIISFHSLEDRPVKQAFAGMAQAGLAADLSRGHAVPADTETASNPRSRSAKLRAIRLRESAASPSF